MSDTTRRSTFPQSAKPRMRGRIHEAVFYVTLAAGPALVIAAPAEARLATSVYALSLTAMFGVSALYHRVTWQPGARAWMRRLDHTTIFGLIAGTYTATATLALEPERARTILALVWAGAAAGVVVNLLWVNAPKWVSAVVYVALGWVALAAVPALYRGLDLAGFSLLVAGGVTYSIGALAYAFHRPNPVPGTIGYHEVFHALVVVAAACHYAMIAISLTG